LGERSELRVAVPARSGLRRRGDGQLTDRH
jgi:hypothetical protein